MQIQIRPFYVLLLFIKNYRTYRECEKKTKHSYKDTRFQAAMMVLLSPR